MATGWALACRVRECNASAEPKNRAPADNWPRRLAAACLRRSGCYPAFLTRPTLPCRPARGPYSPALATARKNPREVG